MAATRGPLAVGFAAATLVPASGCAQPLGSRTAAEQYVRCDLFVDPGGNP